MKKKYLLIVLSLCLANIILAQNKIVDAQTKAPVSYATISFGNGNGIFADDEGEFIFTEKLYSDIDTLYVSALGYSNLKLPTVNLPKTIDLEPQADQLQEVIIQNKPKGKFKIQDIKPTLHDDYYQCWLPTIESEIAVFFPNESSNIKRVTKLYFPIKVEAKAWRKRNRKDHEKKPFSTIFRVHFYENNDGFPGDVVTYDEVVFIATEKTEKAYELDISENDIYMPKKGLFVSLQVLGYADAKGKLLPNKKYQEVKTQRGIVKVSTTFRPLLPFTDQISENRTYVKRIFLDDGDWVLYKKGNIKNSPLLHKGIDNYGIGLKMEVYKQQ